MLKTWAWLHKWSSLVCTVFMLLLCLTGLPLIFHHEIGHLLGTEIEAPPLSAAVARAPRASLDAVLAAAQAVHPERVVQFVSKGEDDPNLWFVTMTPSAARTDDFRSVVVDARTGLVLGQPRFDQGFMHLMFRLHVDLFAGLPGKLFLGGMGLLLLLSLVSGAVLYAPFMKNLDFGSVRRHRRPRLKWLDLHNLLGIVTLVWLFVVGATGAINTGADLIVQYWQHDQLAAILAPYKNQPVSANGIAGGTATRPALSRQQALDNALGAAPGTMVSFVAFPGTDFSSPHHLTFFLRGNSALTARLLQPVLIDAQTGEVSAAPRLPWYLSALLVSQPLHFGDYGGRAMQILWALLDVAAIIVLGSGLYLWLKKRGRINGKT